MDVDWPALLRSWSWEPPVIVMLALAIGLYAVGWWRLFRQRRGRRAAPAWRLVAYLGGQACIALALLSPLETFSGILFVMHMSQHMMLLVGGPLVLLGAPILPLLWALPRGLRRRVGLLLLPRGPLHAVFHALTHPAVTATVFVVVIGVWHVPQFYDAAQGETLIHYVEHLAFLGAGLLYWWPVVHPFGGRRRLGYGTALFYIAPSLIEQNAIGMVLTFANHPLYLTYTLVPRLWGISVVFDQQLAGAVMGLIGAFGSTIAMSVLLVLFLRREAANADRGLPANPIEARRTDAR